MRLTSHKDMIVGLALASGLLCFQMGAFFGDDPPARFYDDLAGSPRPVVDARPLGRPADPRVTTAAFIDGPAEIRAVTFAQNDGKTRVQIALSPGSAAPRLTMRATDGKPTLAITGLNAGQLQQGEGQGLVKHWALSGGGKTTRLDLPLTGPVKVERAFLTHDVAGDRRLMLDLAQACTVRS